MKKIKYNQIGTAARVLGVYVNECIDEHEAEINSAIEYYGLDKKIFYTEAQKRAVAEFSLGREVSEKAKHLIKVLAGERLSNRGMRDLFESKKRISKTNSENAKQPRKKKPSKAELVNFRDKWIYKNGYSRGWIKSASHHYGCSSKTITSIYDEK